MIIILGLGNPEEDYKETRHNIGFAALDKIKERYNFSDFIFNKNFNSLISEGDIKDKKVLLVKPCTFMNNSGISIKKILSYYKTDSSFLFVFHDDIDIEIGKIKTSKERGSAGHKGIESIFKEIKTKNFIRFRIGINNPEKEKKEKAISVVLKKFTKEEKKVIEKAIEEFIESLEF